MLELKNKEVMQISRLHSELIELGLEPRRPIDSKLFVPSPDLKYFLYYDHINIFTN